MRSGFLALCGFAVLRTALFGQTPSPPTITVQPTGVAAHIGDAVTLSATAEGSDPLTFRWYRDGVPLAGATNASLTFASVALADSAVYYLVATNPFGTAPTTPAALYITKRPQTITFAPASTTVVAGSGVTLTATASSGLPVTFTLVSGAATLSGNVLTGTGGNVVVRVTQAGNDTFSAADPVERTFAFTAGGLSPFITSPPLDQTVTAGAAVTFRAAAIGTPAPTYQWQKDGTAIVGATTPTLALPATTLEDAGRYTVTATNPAGAALASAILTVRAAPVITAAPTERTVFAGEGASFTVAVTGFPTPTFQWRRNGVAVPGATNATLSLPQALAASAGRYDVVATNPLGSVTSDAAVLTVVTRDFSGVYLGTFSGTAGDFALYVRPDRSAVFIAHLAALQNGIVASDLRVDFNGAFSASLNTIASAPGTSPTGQHPTPSAAPQLITLRGTLDEATGSVSGGVPEISATFTGTRAARTGTAATLAGFYPAAVLGSASDHGYIVLAPDGQAFALLTNGTGFDSVRGTVNENGRLTATSAAQTTVDLTFNARTVNGTVRNAAATGTLAGASDELIGTSRVANLSIRAVTSPGPGTLITGFVIAGTSSKQVLIRVAGPALVPAPFNISTAVADPTLQLYRGATLIAQNDEWGTPAANTAAITAATTQAGAFPFRPGSADAALLTTLAPGAYSVAVGGGNGTALAEVYEVLASTEPAGTRRLVNISARGLVSPTTPFIAGFVIAGPAPQRVLIRGVGPTLGAQPFNVAGVLPNPQLSLFRNTTVVKTNDDWFRDPDAALIRTTATRAGAFALGANSLDAAMLLFLAPGAYTVQVTGPANANAANSTGVALVEIYEAAP